MNLPANKNKDNLIKLENMIQVLDKKIESLKTEFNLFFSGELKLPPEKEREFLEKSIRELLQYRQLKSSKLNLLIQNINSKFSLYSNMWKKRMNQIETGISRYPRKTTAHPTPDFEKPPVQEESEVKEKTVNLNLNNENSFDFFVKEFQKTFPDNAGNKDKIINNLKLKMISENIISAKAKLSLKNGKVKISIKRTI